MYLSLYSKCKTAEARAAVPKVFYTYKYLWFFAVGRAQRQAIKSTIIIKITHTPWGKGKLITLANELIYWENIEEIGDII